MEVSRTVPAYVTLTDSVITSIVKNYEFQNVVCVGR